MILITLKRPHRNGGALFLIPIDLRPLIRCFFHDDIGKYKSVFDKGQFFS